MGSCLCMGELILAVNEDKRRQPESIRPAKAGRGRQKVIIRWLTNCRVGRSVQRWCKPVGSYITANSRPSCRPKDRDACSLYTAYKWCRTKNSLCYKSSLRHHYISVYKELCWIWPNRGISER